VTLGVDARRRYALLRDATAGAKAARGDPFFQTDDGRRYPLLGADDVAQLPSAAGVAQARRVRR